MKRFIRLLKGFLVLIVLIIITAYITDYNYILKGIRVVYLTGHTTAFIDDYVYFENDTIHNTKPQPWPKHNAYNTQEPTEILNQTNENLETVAFLIFKNDSLWYEKYASGYGPESFTNSFSMAKSVTVALLGKAIKEGFIKDLEQPLGDFLPTFKTTEVTLGDLASMASGLDWNEHYTSPFSITARVYYDDDISQTLLKQQFKEPAGQAFAYKSGNTQLLAMAIEKAVAMPLAAYASTRFWKPLGFEQAAYWQLDDSKNRTAKAYCCIASNARDFARFGKLFKDFGVWNNTQIIDSSFVAKAINPRFEASPEYGYGFWLSNYQGKSFFVMRGILGQYVITQPEDQIIIVRLGHKRGHFDGRPFTSDFYTYIDQVYAMLDAAKK